jgi:hypothetical protein
VLERLIESWLDSAGERSYQRCFCQMLLGQGYRIVHNTEHTPLEHGKDVIAVSPDEKVVGFQLKGNPGKSLKPSQFDEIRGQLEQLATYALGIPGFERKVPDECYLVTNGEIDEAVYAELQRLNAALESRGHAPEKIKAITRGTLLSWANSLGLSLWPSEIEDFSNLIKLLNCEGDEPFPADVFDPLLRHTLRMSQDLKASEMRRRITSAAVMTAVALQSFSRRNNHFAEVTAWTLFSSYAIASCERNGLDFRKVGQDAVLLARGTVRNLLGQLCDEILERRVLSEGDPFSEFAFYRPRALLIYALMGVYWVWCQAEGWDKTTRKAAIEELIPQNLPTKSVWGEGAIPHVLAFTWYRKRVDVSASADEFIASLLRDILSNKLGPAGHLPSPYYGIEDVVKHNHLQILGCDDPYEGDGFQGTSYICESLMMCLVRANLKERCKELWPDFTRVAHERMLPDEAWRFALYRTGEGATSTTEIYPSTMQWKDLRDLFAEHDGSDIPEALKADPILLLLFVTIFPFRASFSAVKFLHRKFDTPIAVA